MTTSSTLVVLFCVATAIAIAVRRLRIPYTVALVLAGLGLGSFTHIQPPPLTKELLFTFFLPGLLFEAAFHLDLHIFRKVWRSAIALAIPGVLLATGLTATLLAMSGQMFGLGESVSWTVGIMFGAIVAATDPVAVTAVFRELKAPPRLAVLVEGESLLNDGIGVVLFSIVVAYLAGAHASVAAMAGQFVGVAGGGVAVGLLVGWIIAMTIKRLDEPMIEIALTMIAAYGAFVLAEDVGVSGVLATVVAGVMCGRHGRDHGMSARSRAATESFWEYVAFALNSIVFLLLGFQFSPSSFLSLWPEILLAFGAMIVARFAVTGALVLVQKPMGEAMPNSWAPVVAWGGLRGALSMVLALALPDDFPQRALLIALTTGVVVISVIVQGLSIPWLLRRMGIATTDEIPDGDQSLGSG